ncbi:transposase [Bacillus swezeyi]|uniref:transposase n=1 Tax=Bacillus swezeyi TaxID=1925020 RepID=UPI0039C5E785
MIGINIYFCDPRSPWQRGSNENINRLLRQNLSKNADLRAFSLRDLDERINTRPRRVLGWRADADHFWPQMRAAYVS